MPGDLFLICSDGLNDMIDDAAIRSILSDNRDNLTLPLNSWWRRRMNTVDATTSPCSSRASTGLSVSRGGSTVSRAGSTDHALGRGSNTHGGKLILSFNDQQVGECELDKESLTIGRRPESDIHIDNLAVSGQHARVMTIAGDSFLEDRFHQRDVRQRQTSEEARARCWRSDHHRQAQSALRCRRCGCCPCIRWEPNDRIMRRN